MTDRRRTAEDLRSACWFAKDDPQITPDHVMVLRNAGPLGGPGVPEWGMLPIPKVLIKQGVRDMRRILEVRISGTSSGACVLHIAPESYVGGPLALLRNSDIDFLQTDFGRAAGEPGIY